MTTAVMRRQNGLIFNFCGILKTMILHNFVNAIVGIEQTFQYVFKSSIDSILPMCKQAQAFLYVTTL